VRAGPTCRRFLHTDRNPTSRISVCNGRILPLKARFAKSEASLDACRHVANHGGHAPTRIFPIGKRVCCSRRFAPHAK
jgi:hypothetical protein